MDWVPQFKTKRRRTWTTEEPAEKGSPSDHSRTSRPCTWGEQTGLGEKAVSAGEGLHERRLEKKARHLWFHGEWDAKSWEELWITYTTGWGAWVDKSAENLHKTTNRRVMLLVLSLTSSLLPVHLIRNWDLPTNTAPPPNRSFSIPDPSCPSPFLHRNLSSVTGYIHSKQINKF